MQISKINATTFKSVTPVTSTKAGFEAFHKAAKEAGKTEYLLNDPNWQKNTAINDPNAKITKYLITGEEYKPYRFMPPCKKLFQAGIYETNRRVPVAITENSKSLIQKLVKRI